MKFKALTVLENSTKTKYYLFKLILTMLLTFLDLSHLGVVGRTRAIVDIQTVMGTPVDTLLTVARGDTLMDTRTRVDMGSPAAGAVLEKDDLTEIKGILLF